MFDNSKTPRTSENSDGVYSIKKPVRIINIISYSSFFFYGSALFIMVVMVYLYVAVVAFVSVIAKSSKEATSYVSPIYIVVMLCGLMTMYSGGTEKALGTFAVPIYGNAGAIKNLMTNELTMEQFLLSVGGTLVCGIIFTVL